MGKPGALLGLPTYLDVPCQCVRNWRAAAAGAVCELRKGGIGSACPARNPLAARFFESAVAAAASVGSSHLLRKVRVRERRVRILKMTSSSE